MKLRTRQLAAGAVALISVILLVASLLETSRDHPGRLTMRIGLGIAILGLMLANLRRVATYQAQSRNGERPRPPIRFFMLTGIVGAALAAALMSTDVP